MKKKTMVFALIMVLALSVTLLAGCGGGSANTDYLSWTGAEWEAASDDDKKEALKAVMIEIQPELEGQDDALKQSVEAMIPSMDDMFKQSPDITLKSVVEQTQNAINSAQDQAQNSELDGTSE